jgi:hypothetical protein
MLKEYGATLHGVALLKLNIMPTKKTPKAKAKKPAKKRTPREDVNQAAFRVVNEATKQA